MIGDRPVRLERIRRPIQEPDLRHIFIILHQPCPILFGMPIDEVAENPDRLGQRFRLGDGIAQRAQGREGERVADHEAELRQILTI